MLLPAALTRYSINTQLRQAHFLAQICEESWGLSDLEEGQGVSSTRAGKLWVIQSRVTESVMRAAA